MTFDAFTRTVPRLSPKIRRAGCVVRNRSNHLAFSRGTLHIPDRAVTLGTMAALQGEVYMDGTSADPTATVLSLLRLIVDGARDGK